MTTFLFAPTPERPTSRYAIHLRLHVQPASHGTPTLGGHLEQVADWDDILVIDLLQEEGQLTARYDWQSALAGATAGTARFLQSPHQEAPGIWSIRLPDVARSILSPHAPDGEGAELLIGLSGW